MTMKRILCTIITVCMFASLVVNIPVSATTEWEYKVGVVISQRKNAGCKKKNAITAKLKFVDGSEETKFLENTNNSPASTVFKTSRAPWKVNGIELANSSKDSLWMYSIYIKVSRTGSNAEEYLLLHYPGNANDTSSGIPIDQDDGGPKSYSVSIDARRDVFDRDNYSEQLSKTYNLSPLGESGTIKREWSGKIKDTYVGFFGNAPYNCMELSDPPNLSLNVSGMKEDGSQVTKDALEKNGVKFLERGYEIDKARLLSYMNDNNMAQIQLKFTLSFPEKTAKKANFDATTTIKRSAVCVESVKYSQNYNYINSDNRYYNNRSGNLIVAAVQLKKTGQFFKSYGLFQLTQKTVELGEVYLTAGDGIKLLANEKNVTTDFSSTFYLSFTLPEGIDSENAGLKLVMNNTYVVLGSNNKCVIWDDVNKQPGLSIYTSTHKIDRKAPVLTVVPEIDVDLSKWNKTVTLNVTPSEETFSSENQPQRGYYTMYLYGNGTYPVIYKYNHTEQNKGQESAFQLVPSSKGFTQKVKLALRDKVEGEYNLIFTGSDEAGNSFAYTHESIKLDNKAPEILVTETQQPQKTDGTKGNIYDVKISDASGTGRLYYMFTEKSRQDAPSVDESNVPKASGDMDTTLDRWAYIEQKDTENGKTAAAYLSVQKGENFNGRMLFFGVDEAGNRTSVYEKSINIKNENTAYDITPKNVERPTSSYNITIDTNSNNTVYYCWKRAADNKYISDFVRYTGSIDTSKDDITKNLNGTYILECKIVPPSNTNIKYVSQEYVFDNAGPDITLSVAEGEHGKETQTVSIYATDAADVLSAKAQIVTPDGSGIEGNEEFSLNVENGILSQNVNIFSIPSGVYALKVTATDTNGVSKSEISDSFLIRNTAPSGTVNVVSNLNYNEKPLIASEDFKLEFNITESLNNPTCVKGQSLYYRIGTALGEYGQWIKVCDVNVADGALAGTAVLDAPRISLADGENTLFVQTVICNSNDGLSKISQSTIKNDEVVFYYDGIVPTVDLVINDIQTKENIEGKLYISDNLGGTVFVSCGSDAVKIGEVADGEVDITVTENVDTFIKISDTAGNQTTVKLVIKGIDKTPPTAEIKVMDEAHGERKDAAATVKVNDVLGETVKFAFIPVDKYRDGKIPEEYFEQNISNPEHFKTTVIRTEPANWDGENNITYKVQIVGTTGEWYLGVRSADSLGNVGDIVFEDSVLSAQDVELIQTTIPKLRKTESKTIVNTRYNVPVYTLPQDKILDAQSDAVRNNIFEIEGFEGLSIEEKVEAANLELAKQYAMVFSDTYSFAIGENGNYHLYTVDDLGRTKHLVANISDVEFGAASDIKVTKYITTWEPDGESQTEIKTPVADNEMICAAAQQCYLIVESVGGDDTLFMPISELDGVYTNGLEFNEGESAAYAYYEDGVLRGYSKLCYDIGIIVDSFENYTPTEVTDRILTVRAFSKGADFNNPDEVSDKTAVITKIDNTAPIVSWSVSPEVLTYEDIEYEGETYKELVPHPTPGNVTFTVTGQDKESGISKIVALEDECCGEIAVPLTDNNGNPTEYWSWEGTEHHTIRYVWDDEIQDYVEKSEEIPIKVEYFGDGDIYGIKTLKYTFSDAYSLRTADMFINSLGAMGRSQIGNSELGLSTEGIIYKIPIEKNNDFNVKYYYEDAEGNWIEIADVRSTYFKNAKVVIDIPEGGRGEERGLYVSNNSGQNEKILNNYSHEFTFKLRDKYGYTMDVPVSLENFDIEPGTIDYELETSAKTNKPYNVTITASDAKSGVGTVKLVCGVDEIPLNDLGGGKYSGRISKNGTYSITLYDKVGNKSVKIFNIKNINTEIPTATVTYSTKDYTSRPVTATVNFSKPNVRIINIAPVSPLTESDYAVNYNTSVITFTKSGTVAVYFEDDYGNSNADDLLLVKVKNIDKTPPTLNAVKDVATNLSAVSVSFDKIDILTSEMDLARKDSEIYVTYGGITKTVADENGNKNSFAFYQNGTYTFRVHDKEGLSSYLTIEITDIDTAAPKITSVSWSYDYDEFDAQNQKWIKKSTSETKVPVDGTAGYIIAPDRYNVTNKDVTVTVKTDSETRLVGSGDEYTDSKEMVYGQNGLFIFNPEKKNGLTTSYGVDVEIIDKTPPTLDLLGRNELVFYENPNMNSIYDISMLKYVENGSYEAYKAYDTFNGVRKVLTSNVEIDWGGFNPNDLSKNTFDSSKPYTITYRVTDSAHNITEAKRIVRLVGMYDTVALVNGNLPDYAGRSEVLGDKIKISLANFAGTAYVRYKNGILTMGQMKKDGEMLSKNLDGDFEAPSLTEGWYTFYIQTDKRDYFTLHVYLSR